MFAQIYPSLPIRVINSHARGTFETIGTHHSSQVAAQAHTRGSVLLCDLLLGKQIPQMGHQLNSCEPRWISKGCPGESRQLGIVAYSSILITNRRRKEVIMVIGSWWRLGTACCRGLGIPCKI